MSGFGSIAAFRLVTHQLQHLVAFYEMIGFAFAGSAAIAADEMRLLGLKGSGLRARLTLGDTWLELDEFEFPGWPYPASVTGPDRRFQHLALVTGNTIEAAWERVLAAGAIPISTAGPVRLPESSGGVTAVKFRDPEGHPLELLQFPDSQAPRSIERIGHSAISVSSVTASIAFYERAGLKVEGRTINIGAEQSALDNVSDPCVDVVPMKSPAARPHIELLHYRGIMSSGSFEFAANAVCATRVVWHSDRDALIRDPDGHYQQLAIMNGCG
jgi:catechol 2,3-dioxygenase-like lactoylglutathione lyase family enzyme